MAITKLEQILDAVKSKSKKRLVAAWAVDAHTIEAVNNAMEKGIVEGILVGDENMIQKACKEHNIDVTKFRIVHETTEEAAATRACDLVNKKEADIIMKGLVSTDKYMRAILHKEKGLMQDKVLSHVTVMETPNYHKLLVVADVAIIPNPDFAQKIAITNFLIRTAKALNIETPKVAVIGPSEMVHPAIISTTEAAMLTVMNQHGQIKGAKIDGPLAMDLAIDMESVQIKGIKSEVAGDADCLLFPNIESANVFYKTNTKLCNAELGAVVFGAKVPAVLSSRGDSVLTKLYSIALAALLA